MNNKFITEGKLLQSATNKPSQALLLPAWFFSIVFHPLFIPVIAAWYLAFVHQYFFEGITPYDKAMIIVKMAYNTIFFPAFTVLLLKALGFIKSIFLKTQKERILPYVAANFFYFWMYLVFRNQPQVPLILTRFIFGIFLSSSAALFANSYFKISMHALGMGALLGLIMLIIVSGFSYAIFLSAAIIFLLAGIVCTSRMLISNHTPFDIYSGLFIAIVCQIISAAFIG